MTGYLSRDELLDLHLFAVERWGGRFGIRSQDRLLAILHAPRQAMFGVELYPTLADKTAALVFQLVKHRPFHSGNEATALLAGLRMLAINHAQIDDVGVAAMVTAISEVLASRMSRNELAQWFREQCRLQDYLYNP